MLNIEDITKILAALAGLGGIWMGVGKAIAFKPDKHQAWYNKACCYGLQAKLELAIESLQHAITLDPENRELAKTDTDFDLIRQDDRFQALLAQ